MSKRLKQLLTVTFIVFLCLHFALIFFFASPLKYKTGKISYISAFYCHPYFQQSWGLFVPAPNAQHQLFVRYKTQTSWSNWTDILQKEYLKHRANRLSGNETIVLLLSNSTHHALNVLTESQSVYSKIPDKKELRVLNYEIEQYLKINDKLKQGTDYEILIANNTTKGIFASYFKFLKIK